MRYMGVDLGSLSVDFPDAGMEPDRIVEEYTSEGGESDLVDLDNTTAHYDATANSYNEGLIQTKRLYYSEAPIFKLVINEITSHSISSRGVVDVSFDDGVSWSSGKSLGEVLESFSGTSDDSGVYKLKLRFNLSGVYSTILGSWVTASSMNEARVDLAGCGTAIAALAFGGGTGAVVDSNEIWNGSSWSVTGSLNTAREYLSGCGTTSAALSMGGYTGAVSSVVERWNGTTWTNTTAMNVARYGAGGCGTVSSALCMGGYGTSHYASVEKWNGSAWATTGGLSMNTARRYLSGCGNASEALAFGGSSVASPVGLSEVERWNGSSWVTTNGLSQSRYSPASCGSVSLAFCMGGYYGGVLDSTERWGGSSWSTTTSLVASRSGVAGCGTTTAALAFGGTTGGVYAGTERWYSVGNQLGFSVSIN